jgi:ATP phosphoribosyltransferase
MRKVVIALPKGKRLLPQAYDVFRKAGVASHGLEIEIGRDSDMKQLEFESDDGTAYFLLVRVADIPQYVDRNWADIGISAFDCYREYELSNISDKQSMRGDNFVSDLLPNLRLCENSRFCVAGLPEKKDFYERCKQNHDKIMEVATQHPHIASRYFAGKDMIADIMSVSGSTELMPKQANVDVIFDIVESGRALKENGLIIYEEAMRIKTKVLVSKAALKYDENISKMIEKINRSIKNGA